MQFRKSSSGKLIQLARYSGYDKVAKRSTIKIIGSFHAYLSSLADDNELWSLLTDSEAAELREYFVKQAQKYNQYEKITALKNMEKNIDLAIEALKEGHAPAENIIKKIDELKKALKKSGVVNLKTKESGAK